MRLIIFTLQLFLVYLSSSVAVSALTCIPQTSDTQLIVCNSNSCQPLTTLQEVYVGSGCRTVPKMSDEQYLRTQLINTIMFNYAVSPQGVYSINFSDLTPGTCDPRLFSDQNLTVAEIKSIISTPDCQKSLNISQLTNDSSSQSVAKVKSDINQEISARQKQVDNDKYIALLEKLTPYLFFVFLVPIAPLLFSRLRKNPLIVILWTTIIHAMYCIYFNVFGVTMWGWWSHFDQPLSNILSTILVFDIFLVIYLISNKLWKQRH